MSVLVDTSIWIEYFRSADHAEKLEYLIDENLIVINDIILAELVPFLKVRNQRKLIELLRSISKLMLSIDWDQIIEFQFKCLRNGLNGIGIPDLILAQNAKQHQCAIYSLDNHFELMKDILKLKLLV
ncbi:MAG: PIN domain-containing protein [Thermodesulfobacteriota bacterium]|nr:PIN domain-containing protein [Thermodesulfobacteriota bacterium]